MKQIKWMVTDFFSVAVLVLLFAACAGHDYPNTDIDGMWKLRTMHIGGEVQQVDTVFFSFHRGSLFSCKRFDGEMTQMQDVWMGYFGFSHDNSIHISLAESYGYQTTPWGDGEQKAVFNIVQHTSSKLVLERNGITYNFIDF